MHESEIGLQSIIDPYARGDFFISFGEEGVNLEEGYITFTALPRSFVAKVGKMRSAFGKVNTLHNHVLPWVDRPLVTTNLVGGEDGIDDAGFSVERILPAPKGIFLEATGQVFRGDSGDDVPVFQPRTAATSARWSICAAIKILPNPRTSISESPTRAAITTLGDRLSDPACTASMQRCAGSRCGAPSTIRSSGAGEFIWSQRQQLPAEQTVPSAFIPRRTTSWAGAGLSAGASTIPTAAASTT